MLPERLAEAFGLLSGGRHICADDGDVFFDLQNRADDYARIFTALGFKMEHDGRGFFYFHGSAKGLASSTERIALFMFILVDWLADRGEGIIDTLFGRDFVLDELPHLDVDRYRRYLREAGVDSKDELRDVIRKMANFGFIRSADGTRFRCLPPTHRLLDASLALVEAFDEDDKEATHEE